MKWYGNFCKTSNAAVMRTHSKQQQMKTAILSKLQNLGVNTMSYVGSTSFYEKDEFSNLIEFRRFNIK